MYHVLGRFKVDLEQWKKVTREHRAAHEDAGLRFKQVWRNVDDSQEIFFLFEAWDLGRARVFLEKARALDQERQRKGEIPVLTFLQDA